MFLGNLFLLSLKLPPFVGGLLHEFALCGLIFLGNVHVLCLELLHDSLDKQIVSSWGTLGLIIIRLRLALLLLFCVLLPVFLFEQSVQLLLAAPRALL